MNRKLSYTPLLYIAGILAITTVVVVLFQKPYTFHGTVLTPPLPVTDFTLQTGESETFSLSAARGKLVLLFFGYTSCPDVCPTTLAELRQASENLGDDARNIQVVMVTADPERDTPEKMKAYVAHFDPNFIGVSGNLADLEAIWEELGVFVEKEDTGSAAGYLVSHTSSVYVLDRNGNLILMFPYGTSAVDIASDLSELLKQTKQ
ncbi:MAG: SCO family protein [Anaerolineaceae bacterium]|jgi:protein SCO1/2|nr:MAG: SCO family protein [Anaerolineaceae bacterium]